MDEERQNPHIVMHDNPTINKIEVSYYLKYNIIFFLRQITIFFLDYNISFLLQFQFPRTGKIRI